MDDSAKNNFRDDNVENICECYDYVADEASSENEFAESVTSTPDTENSAEHLDDTGSSVESMANIFKELSTANSPLTEDEVEVLCSVFSLYYLIHIRSWTVLIQYKCLENIDGIRS